nr:immunoglobulin light chain junction region [Macaca mulatta]MOW39283.1 immunoglobulin light chain junction region [Macaca mulatta]MOW39313.1 immunoglobulin light chain junction region [Macaca mulatta]MOW39484.1 immunoglobulin light chain junction region [Macaca mulatta]MOW39487.1 immunoglobulin light chain junction region [Macaca mulatta]
CQQYTTWNTF